MAATFGSSRTLLTNMQAVGVPIEDARWYHAVARPRGFSGRGDAARAQRILQNFYKLCKEAREAKVSEPAQVPA